LLFFLSGALGLGYEFVWIRKAALVVGASQIALSTVLTSFFLGIALGSYVVGRYLRSRRVSPLFVYGVFEAAIGLFALAFPLLFEGLEEVYGVLYPLAAASDVLLFALRFGLLFALLLLPTFFMGGTLPLLLDGLVAEDRAIGSRTSLLYGINILGAVAGVLVTCYVAIPHLGMNGTSVAGGVGNLAIGAVALLAFRRHPPLHLEAEGPERLGAFFPLAALASGCLAIAYQVAWARYFTLLHTTTVYFTAMLLAVYLLALAAGSLVLAPLLQARWSPLKVLGYAQSCVPLLTLYGIHWWRAAGYRVALDFRQPETREALEIDASYAGYFLFWSEAADAVFFAPLFQIALVVFLPVTLIGMGLPCLITAAARRSADLRSVSGVVVFWNTVGSSLGGFLGGYLFLHVLGLHWTLLTLGLGSLGLSAAAMTKASAAKSAVGAAPLPVAGLSRQERKRAAREAARASPQRSGLDVYLGFAGVSLAGIACFGALVPDVTRTAIREFGYGSDRGARTLELKRFEEGPLTTTWIFENDESVQIGAGHVALAVTYKKTWSTQAIQGHVPALLYPGKGVPERGLGICLGSGQSFGALLLYPIEKLDVVDISSEMIELSLEHYRPYNHDLGADERVSIHLDDGRHFVDRAESASYDVVSMEPPPPTADGVASLYSLEFYEGVRRILRPGGLFMQWLPLYRVTPLDAKGIVKTQAEVFPETFVVKVGIYDFMVVSYLEHPRFDVEAIRERCKTFATERNIKGSRWTDGVTGVAPCKHEIASLEGVLSTLLAGPAEVAGLEAPLVYRDDNQLLSYSSGDRHLLRLYEGPALAPIAFAALELTPFRDLAPYFDPPLSAELCAELDRERARSLFAYRVPDPDELAEALRRFEAGPGRPEKAYEAFRLASFYDACLKKDEAFRWLERHLENASVEPDSQRLEIARGIVRNHLAVYADLTERWIARFEAAHAGLPLVRAMRAELEAYRKRESAKNALYLFP
jgi:predicted membrane-bound spermidine synthase